MFGEDFQTCFIIGRLGILLFSPYDKSRMTGDCHYGSVRGMGCDSLSLLNIASRGTI